MNRIKHLFEKLNLSRFIVSVDKQYAMKGIIVCLTITYVLVAYYSHYMGWYNKKIIPILNHFEPSIWLNLLIIVLIVLIINDILKKFRIKYQYGKISLLALLAVSILLIYCRFIGEYNYVKCLLFVSYVDVIIILCVVYFIAGLINSCRRYYQLVNDKSENDESHNELAYSILDDWPIENIKDDIFDLEEEAKKIADKTKSLDKRKTWSIAITAPWGAGKTSFLNLILEYISENDFEIVHFIPRDSKSFQTIQEDFFSYVASILSKYDSRCNNTLKDYMASLQLIDNRGFVEKLVNFYRIWNKESLKDSIKNSFASLDKKVLVLIDDFDRLSKEEILEVLKLIDSNAAFTNLVFLTAYDKEQVNKSLGESFKTGNACYIDKFFNLEYSIPSRPYSYISHYIEDKLYEILNASDKEKNDINKILSINLSIFEKYLPTLRDAKRFINQFVLDFIQVRGDVFVDEFILVQLIKYRYPELYKSLYRHEYTEKGDLISGMMNIMKLKKDIDEDLNILPILKLLFPDGNRENSFRHIFDRQSFDNYFVNQIYSSLRIRDMQELFALDLGDVKSKINEWIINGKSKDYIDYLFSLDMDNFDNGSIFLRYAEIVSYVVSKLPTTRVYWLFAKIISTDNLKGYDHKYNINYEQYKTSLINIVKENDSELLLLSDIHMRYKTYELKEEEYLIKDNDIWPYFKNKFIQLTNEDNVGDDWIISLLYRCIEKMEEGSRILILDSDCLKAYRNRIIRTPAYYIAKFVRLLMTSSNPEYNSVTCEPFWEQIFGDSIELENYLNDCNEKKVEKANLAGNFWRLFKANDYNPIKFMSQGPVQDKIDNNLEVELNQLNEIEKIQEEVMKIPDEIESVSDEDILIYKQSLSQNKQKLGEIALDIKLKEKILEVIKEKLMKYS